jgi:RNA polymerase sigma-70 factor, ECF subfamily
MLRTDTNTETFLAVRDRLLRIARTIAGDAADPEDVVQDAWLRWNRADRDVVRNAPAYLRRTTIWLSLNAVQSAHVRHRSALELPTDQPDPTADPALLIEGKERLQEAMHMLTRRLTPREQAAYVLRESFSYSHRDIADLLLCTPVNARQITRRAAIRVRNDPTRHPSQNEQPRLLAAFLEATSSGNTQALIDLATTK